MCKQVTIPCFAFLFLLFFAGESLAETRRALLIGIDIYQPTRTESPASGTQETVKETGTASSVDRPVQRRGGWYNLDGAVNDAEAMREVLIARYGFLPDNIRILRNQEATRERILTEIRQHLIESATPGDVYLFYYAGHGSQVTNSQSTEPDKKDETIVPADANQGVWDIRDKELRRLFNDVLDKGASLIVILDSCHSGSVARGLVQTEKARFLPPDPRDVATVVGSEPPDPRPAPEERGALVFSAAQDFQIAHEATDEELGTKHGAFTLALLKTLRTVQIHEPAERVFLRVKALLQTTGRFQEPVLAGTADRRQKSLLGIATRGLPDQPTIAVLRIQADNMVELQGGLAMGLRKQSELRKVDSSANTSTVRLRVEQVQGWSRATARIIAGNPQEVRVGDLFVVDRWADSDEVFLRVWIPPATLPYADLISIAQVLAPLQTSDRIEWVEDPTETLPTHILLWDGSVWKLMFPGGQSENMGQSLTAQEVLAKVSIEEEDKAKLFVYFPPPTELVENLQWGSRTGQSTIELLSTPQEAHYLLVGRVQGNDLSYAWMLPYITQQDIERNSPLPVRTDWVRARDAIGSFQATASQLREFTQRIGRIRAWLQLESPLDKGSFPYTLALKNSETGVIMTSGIVKEGEQFRLMLRASEDSLKRGVEKRYVYVFVMDSFGNSTLLFPFKAQGNIENHFPYDTPPPVEIYLPTQIQIAPPFGIDTYFLLTSREAIAPPEVLEFQGVRTRDEAPTTPLAHLLYTIGSEVRGAAVVTPIDWSITALSLRSAPR